MKASLGAILSVLIMVFVIGHTSAQDAPSGSEKKDKPPKAVYPSDDEQMPSGPEKKTMADKPVGQTPGGQAAASSFEKVSAQETDYPSTPQIPSGSEKKAKEKSKAR